MLNINIIEDMSENIYFYVLRVKLEHYYLLLLIV